MAMMVNRRITQLRTQQEIENASQVKNLIESLLRLPSNTKAHKIDIFTRKYLQ